MQVHKRIRLSMILYTSSVVLVVYNWEIGRDQIGKYEISTRKW